MGTAIDCLMLLVASWKISARGGISRCAIQPVMKFSRIIKKLSMLDVAIMGVVVVVMSLISLRSKGVIVAARGGLLALFGAEICHYVAYYLVTRAAQNCISDVSKEKPVDPEDVMPVPEAVVQIADVTGDGDAVLEATSV